MVIKVKKERNYFFIGIIFMIASLSYICNMGWIRFVFFIAFFIYYLIVFSISILFVSKSNEYLSLNQEKWFYIELVTFLFVNMFLPDYSDTGGAYCCFGLISIPDEFINNLETLIGLVFLFDIFCIVKNILTIKQLKIYEKKNYFNK